MLSPTITSILVSNSSVFLTLSQPSGSLSVDMYSVVFTSTACPNIESRSASTTTNSLTVDNLEAGVLYSYTLIGANTVAELTRTTTSTTTTMETGRFSLLSSCSFNNKLPWLTGRQQTIEMWTSYNFYMIPVARKLCLYTLNCCDSNSLH